MQPTKKKKRLGEMLVEAGVIDRLQLRSALIQQEQWGKPLGRTLVEMRLVTEDQLVRTLSEQLHLPTIDLGAVTFAPEALAFLPEAFCREHECLPFAYDTKNRFLDIAMSDVQNQLLYDTLRVRTRCNVRPFLAGPDAIRDAIERAFGQNLMEMELQFQLSENLFDFGLDDPVQEELRHVDPAVRPTTGLQEVIPSAAAAAVAAATSQTPSRSIPNVAGPFSAPPNGGTQGPAPNTTGPFAAVPQAAPGPYGGYAPQPFMPQPGFPQAPLQQHPSYPGIPVDALAQSFPAYPTPIPQPAGITPVGLGELVMRQQMLEERLANATARIQQHEVFLQRLLGDLRGLFGQLAQMNLIDAQPDHPLLPHPGRGKQPAPTPVPVPELEAVPELEPVPILVPVQPAELLELPLPPPARPSPSALPPPPAGMSLPPPGPSRSRSAPHAAAPVEQPRPRSVTPARVEAQPEPPRRPAREPALAAPRTEGAPAPLVTAPRRPVSREIRPAAPRLPTGAEAELPLLELPADTPTAVAMDLGTTRSSVATVVNGRVSVLKLPGGDWDIPSVVGFRADGQVVLGKNARRMLSTDVENVIASPKRLLGRRFDEPALGPYLAQLGMKATAGRQNDIVLHSRGRQLSVTEACAHLLKLLRLVGERTLGRPVHDVILTVPATSGERQLRALSAAAATAELRVVEFLHEPVAAAMACMFDEACDGRVAVYDFGGGTFDFSVVELGAEAMQVVATSGDSWLGGDDFDSALAAAAANACWQQHKVELRNQAHHWQALLVACESAKRALSQLEEAVVRLPGAIRKGDTEAAFEWTVTRKKFAELTRGIVERSLESCQEALTVAKMRPQDLNAIYLSGGTSYIPSVQEAVAAFFNKPPRVVIPPERMVVVGAAVHGALMPSGD